MNNKWKRLQKCSNPFDMQNLKNVELSVVFLFFEAVTYKSTSKNPP